MRAEVGSLVRLIDGRQPGLMGIVVSLTPMQDSFRDPGKLEQVHVCEILWNKDVPGWMGTGRIITLTDGMLEVVA